MENNITLQDLLKEWGLKVNDIRSRIGNDTIEINGEIVSDIKLPLGVISEARSTGSFLQIFMDSGLFTKFGKVIPTFGLCNLMSGESNIENELTKFLSEWKMVTISSHNSIFLKLGVPGDGGVLFDREGDKPTFIKMSTGSDVIVVDVDKLKSDLEKVNKQLSNPGFVDNAPEFKVSEAKARQKRLEEKLAIL
jgi:hypothetical protein